MRSDLYSLALTVFLILVTNASPISHEPLHSVEQRSPLSIFGVHSEGGHRYQATEPHTGHISSADLNAKSKQFHDDVQHRYQQDHPEGKYPPNMVSAHKHDDHIYYSSSQRVDPGMSGMPQPHKYDQTAQQKTDKIKALPKNTFPKEDQNWKANVDKGKSTVKHRAKGKCSEGGTCGMIETKHGSDVSMHGDKISSYGTAGKPGLPGLHTGHHEGCTPDPKKDSYKAFGCSDVITHHGLDDVNKPGRKASISKKPKRASHNIFRELNTRAAYLDLYY